jgi:hypothetical protein
MQLVSHVTLVAVVHLHRDRRLGGTKIFPQAIVSLIAVDKYFDLMTRLQLYLREQLDCVAEEWIAYRGTPGWIARNTDCSNRRTSHDIENANEKKDSEKNADKYQSGINGNLHSAVPFQLVVPSSTRG